MSKTIRLSYLSDNDDIRNFDVEGFINGNKFVVTDYETFIDDGHGGFLSVECKPIKSRLFELYGKTLVEAELRNRGYQITGVEA